MCVCVGVVFSTRFSGLKFEEQSCVLIYTNLISPNRLILFPGAVVKGRYRASSVKLDTDKFTYKETRCHFIYGSVRCPVQIYFSCTHGFSENLRIFHINDLKERDPKQIQTGSAIRLEQN